MAGDVSTSQTDLSAPVTSMPSAPNMDDYFSMRKLLNGNGDGKDVANLFWDLITGGQVSQLQKAQYDNDYNEYLYNRYQSIPAQARQLEKAGLNRNFAQTGPSGTPQSAASANLSNNGIANSINIVKGVNTLISSIMQGVNIIQKVTNFPYETAFKHYRNILAEENGNIARSRAMTELSKAYYDQIYYGGHEMDAWTDTDNSLWDPLHSKAMTQAGLRNDVMELTKKLRDYDLENLKPQEYKRLQELTNRIGQQAEIDKKTLEYFDANTILPFVFAFLKMFL